MRTRRWIGAAALVAATALLAACSSGGGSGNSSSSSSGSKSTFDPTAPVKMTYVSYGGTGQQAQIDAWQKPYSEKYPNVTFANSSPPDPAQVKAQVTSGQVQWNAVTTAPYLASQNCGTLYQKLTIPNLTASDYDNGIIGDCYIADFRYSLVFTYSTDAFPDPAKAPKTIADFFDTKKFPGKRGIVPTIQDGFLETALLADGVKAKDLYPVDVDRALTKWDTIKSDTIFAANPGALLQDVTSHQVVMEMLVQARTQAALDAGAHIKPVWDQTITSIDGLAIPKGSPNTAAIENFYSFLLQPEQQAKMASLAGVAPVNKQSKPSYTANGNLVNAFGPANTGTTVPIDADYWGKNINQATSKVTTWLAG
ncbi:MAG TPA: extracellular solute-binding protein [Gryllotalpicola sp.]